MMVPKRASRRRRLAHRFKHVTHFRLIETKAPKVPQRIQHLTDVAGHSESTQNLGVNVRCGEESLVIRQLNQWCSGVT